MGCKPENLARPSDESESKLIKVALLCQTDAPNRNGPKTEESTDLVGVQVYTNLANGRYAYARGLFCSSDKIPEIELYENKEYSIDVSIVSNGQKLVYQRQTDWSYYRPFLAGLSPTPINNAFVYAISAHTYLSQGAGDIGEDGSRVTYRRPLWERYAGYSGSFTARDSAAVHIVARRVYAALQLRVEGLASGHIEIELLESPIIKLTTANNLRDTTIMISLSGTTPPSEIWTTDGYSEVVNCIITHVSPTGAQSVLTPDGGRKITLTRNHTIPIVIRPDQSGRLKISVESGPMIEDEPIVI